jgi:stearoyl-CoA desaturase (delta-9 desaturase)
LASFLAPELTQRLNTAVSSKQYEQLKRSIGHVGLSENSYADFQKTGCIENARSYCQRVVTGQSFWLVTVFAAGGWRFVVAWCASIFVITVLIRDFNWRGHGGNRRRSKKPGWEFDTKSHALNQRFYGLLASEWHDNHHSYPMSANNGFLAGQLDMAFAVIKFLRVTGVVSAYIDAFPRFKKDFLARAPANG